MNHVRIHMLMCVKKGKRNDKRQYKIEMNKYKKQNKFQRKGEKIKISLFIKRETTIKMLDNPPLLAAKVVTFNERDKVSGGYFTTI